MSTEINQLDRSMREYVNSLNYKFPDLDYSSHGVVPRDDFDILLWALIVNESFVVIQVLNEVVDHHDSGPASDLLQYLDTATRIAESVDSSTSSLSAYFYTVRRRLTNLDV